MTKIKSSYSLWLRPTQEQIDGLTKIISRLAHRYRTTPFPPHITLLSSISTDLATINRACKKAVDNYHAFDIGLEEISYTNLYFKNLFINARTEGQLIKLHEDITDRLNYCMNEKYSPHVSLLYGALDEKLQQTLKKELDGNYINKFNCQRLDVYNTTTKENQWHLIESYTLA